MTSGSNERELNNQPARSMEQEILLTGDGCMKCFILFGKKIRITASGHVYHEDRRWLKNHFLVSCQMFNNANTREFFFSHLCPKIRNFRLSVEQLKNIGLDISKYCVATTETNPFEDTACESCTCARATKQSYPAELLSFFKKWSDEFLGQRKCNCTRLVELHGDEERRHYCLPDYESPSTKIGSYEWYLARLLKHYPDAFCHKFEW